jgi:hypothetical protein
MRVTAWLAAAFVILVAQRSGLGHAFLIVRRPW